MLEAKAVLLGPVSAGKTTLGCRVSGKDFSKSFLSKTGVNFFVKTLANGKLILWDVDAHEIDRNMLRLYGKEAACFLFCVDCSSADEVNKGKEFLRRLKEKYQGEGFSGTSYNDPSVPKILVFTKSDLLPDFQVSAQLLDEFRNADIPGLSEKHFLCSAKTGDGVEDVLKHLNATLFPMVELTVRDKPKEKSSSCFSALFPSLRRKNDGPEREALKGSFPGPNYSSQNPS